MITHPKLTTKLDSIPESLTDLLRKWRNSPKVYKWCRQNDLLSESHHRNWMQNHPNDPRIKMYLIKDDSNRPVGVCGLTDIDLLNQRAEFSLYIGPDYQGQGYGKDALKLLCYHGFNILPLKVIWGESFDGNPAIGMFESVGFKKEGVRRNFYFREGNSIDAVLVSITRDELIL